ncbi:unnamed protein product [Boreogadus saida]
MFPTSTGIIWRMLPDLSHLNSEPEPTRFGRIWLFPGVDQQSIHQGCRRKNLWSVCAPSPEHSRPVLPGLRFRGNVTLPAQETTRPILSGSPTCVIQFLYYRAPNVLTALDSGTRMQLVTVKRAKGKPNKQITCIPWNHPEP